MGVGVQLTEAWGEGGSWRARGEVLWQRRDAIPLSTQVWSGPPVRNVFHSGKVLVPVHLFVTSLQLALRPIVSVSILWREGDMRNS